MVGFSVQDNYQALENVWRLLTIITNETSEFVRNQHKAELSPDAKATPAATPKPPSPSTTGASSSASSSSSSVFSSWKFRPSFSKYALTLGPLGVLGAGALLYSLSGNADGGSDDRRKSSKWKAEIPFFNRSNEQKVFDKNLKGIPGVIAVLVGPPSCGKSRFLKEMVDRKPVIVIDEANNLMDWTEPGPSQPKLKTMLDFVVAISKEANLVHVILATSDYFLASWLKVKGVATNNFRIHVLGDVTEEEAREFVYGTAVGATIDPLFVAAPDVAAPVVTWPGIINDPSEPIAVPGGAVEQWAGHLRAVWREYLNAEAVCWGS
ncbi:hypothetical protein Ndes2437A_g08230 [Nannochloris sp. 'desiccata']